MAESGVRGGVGVSDEKVGSRKKGPEVVPGVKGIIMQTMGKGMRGIYGKRNKNSNEKSAFATRRR